MSINFLLADDHRLFRQGLAGLIRQQPGWEVIGEAEDGDTAVMLVDKLQPDVVLLDVEMPGLNGIEATHLICRYSPARRVIGVSMYADVHYQRRMFEAGALGYVLKNEAMDDLVHAIQAVLEAKRFISPALLRDHPLPLSRSPNLDRLSLSERETEVLRLLAEGRRNTEIADLMSISVKSVETYRSRLMVKLGIDNIPALVKFAIRAGIVSLDEW